MKICGISDLHGQLSGYTIPEADILCICGDISPLKFQFNIPSMDGWFKKRFIPWCQKQPVEQVYLIAGNHDNFLENRHYTIHKYLMGTKINYIEDSLCEYVDDNGKIWKIWGTPWCHIFGNWAFMRSPEFETEKFSLIPEDVDILLTHDPIFGYCDISRESKFNNKTHLGNKQLYKRLLNFNYNCVSICGHIHTGDKGPITFNNITCYNASLLNESYIKTFNPILIKL